MSESVKKNQSLKRALVILEKMSTISHPMKLQELSDMLEMSSSTVLRFLNTFIDYGYVRHDNDEYYLSLKLALIGEQVKENYPYIYLLSKYLKLISKKFNESASLCIEENMQMVYIATEEGPNHMLQTLSRIGRVAPMHATGVGKLHMLNYTEENIDELIKVRGLERFTSKTLCTKEELMAELEEIRKNGYAFDNEECEIGVKCIAVPVYDSTEKVIAAISISVPISRLDFNRTKAIIDYLLDVSKMASVEMGYKGFHSIAD